MAKYLDSDGVAYLWSKIKNKFAPLASPGLTGTPTAPTPSTGDDSTKIATTAFVQNTVSSMTSGVSGVKGDAEANYRTGNVSLGPDDIGAVEPVAGLQVDGSYEPLKLTVTSGHYYLDNGSTTRLIPSGGSTNQVLAKNSATDYDLKWVAQTTNTDTKNTAGSNNSTSKLYLVGTTSQTTGTNGVQSYSNTNVYATNGALVAGSFNGIPMSCDFSASTPYMQIGRPQSGPAIRVEGATGVTVLGAAASKGVDTSISAGSTSTNVPTSAAVASLITTATTGALNYQGVVTAQSGLGTTYKKGYYWIVGSVTAGTQIAGQVVETGDMILAHADYSGTIANDVDVVQSNVDRMTNTDIDNAITAGEAL